MTQANDFPRAARLRASPEFDRVFRTGRKVVGAQLVAWLLPSPAGVERSRLGLAVGRRVGNAVARNRVKRLLRDAFRHEAARLAAPHDVVLVPRATHRLTSAASAREALVEILQRHAAPRSGGEPGRRRRRAPKGRASGTP